MKPYKSSRLPLIITILVLAISLSFGISSLNRFGYISDDWHSIFYYTHNYYSDFGIKLHDFFKSNDFSPYNVVGQLLNIFMYSVARYSKIAYSLPNPTIFTMFNFVITLFVGYVSYLLIKSLINSRSLSLFGALLIALYPAKSTSLFWYSSIIANFELLLFLISLYLLYLFIKKRNILFAIGSLFLFILSCLCYNFAIFMSPAVLIFLIYLWRKNVFKAIFLGMLYVSASAGIIYSKLSIFVEGGKKIIDNHLVNTIDTTFNNTFGWNFISFSKPLFLKGAVVISNNIWLILLLIVLISLLVIAINTFGAKPINKRKLLLLFILGFSLFIISCLSTSNTTYFSPSSFNIGNRINVFPCLGLSMVLISMVGYIFSDKSYIVKYILAVICLFLITINTGISTSYKESFDYQKNIISFVEQNKSKIELNGDNHFILLDKNRDTINSIPTIDSSWGLGYMLDGTLGLKTTRSHSTVLSNSLVLAEDSIVSGQKSIPYNGYYVNYDTNTFKKFTNRSDLIDIITDSKY